MVFHVCIYFALYVAELPMHARHAHSTIEYDSIRIMRVIAAKLLFFFIRLEAIG